MTSQQLANDLQTLVNVVSFVQGLAPNAVSADMLAFLQRIENDQSILSFVSALVNALLPGQQPAPSPPTQQ